MFYGQMGGKDLLKRKWKDLAEFMTLECDGKDITSKLKELKVHAVVFLNIARYKLQSKYLLIDFINSVFKAMGEERGHGTGRWVTRNRAQKMDS